MTFTGLGTCLVDFNDAGNASFAAAKQVEQSIKVYASNVITVSKPPAAGSARGSFSPGASATSGDGVLKTIDESSSGCSISSGKVTFTGLGTCRVDFNDAGNGPFAAASQLQEKITVYAANVISASTAPAAGTVNGSYAASAKTTSGDVVAITLDVSSTGCSINKGDVTFTTDGNCTIDFNDVGNGAFAAATQVQQNIVVGLGERRVQSALTLTSIKGTYDKTLTLTSSGGSGLGLVTYDVKSTGSAGCSISGATLTATRVGTCTVTVTATKAQDASYLVVSSPVTTVSMVAHLPARPRAVRVSVPVWTSRSVVTSIIGAGFYGQPRIYSNVGGTRIGVVRDTGRRLTIRASIAKGTPRGVHTFTLVFAHGESTSVQPALTNFSTTSRTSRRREVARSTDYWRGRLLQRRRFSALIG